jgi:DNA adenine methylase
LNSFIAWIGGKKLLRKYIIEKFPVEYERYIEVFGGAGWVLFGKEQGKELEVFNDIDSNLINLYRCIKYHCNELQRELEWLIVSREQFFNYKDQLNSKGFTDIQRAARYFYIIKSSFGADRKTFGTNKKNLVNTIDYLSEINDRLKNVVIENMDYERLIKVYDRPNALFYLDPPYLGTENFYDSGFNINDHIKLNEKLKQIEGKFILSYNDDDYIREIYSDFNIQKIARNNNLASKSKSGEFREVIITNY